MAGRDDDYELVGLKPLDPRVSLTAGAHFIAGAAKTAEMTKVG